jgi:ADP-ribose pyrophosphatase
MTSTITGLYAQVLNYFIYSTVTGGTFTAIANPIQEQTFKQVEIMKHSVHLTSHPAYPARSKVKTIYWDEIESSYSPIDFTHKVVLENDCTKKPNGWADPMEVTPEFEKVLANRISNSIKNGGKVVMINGKPRNPIGRTGMIGRGLLGKYGPNHAADPLVTRYDPETGHLQMVAIQRADTKQWAIPGGMVDPGETVSLTLKREFTEEARNLKNNGEEDQMNARLDDLFKNGGTIVYIGYVDDPRNTDVAWMEVSFHDYCEQLKRMITNQAFVMASDTLCPFPHHGRFPGSSFEIRSW